MLMGFLVLINTVQTAPTEAHGKIDESGTIQTAAVERGKIGEFTIFAITMK